MGLVPFQSGDPQVLGKKVEPSYSLNRQIFYHHQEQMRKNGIMFR